MIAESISTEWIKKFLDFCKQSPPPKDFIGNFEVNVFKGGITNVVVRQSFKEEKTT